MDDQEIVDDVDSLMQFWTDPIQGTLKVSVLLDKTWSIEDGFMVHHSIAENSNVVESLVDVVKGRTRSEEERSIDKDEPLVTPEL